MRKSKKKRVVKRPKNTYKEESRVIRLSPEVDKMIRTLGHRDEAYDNILRRLLGLPANQYQEETSKTLWTIAKFLFEDEAEARGEAVRLAVKLGQKVSPVVKVRGFL